MKTIHVLDEVGTPVLRYIVVDDTHGRVFYGGNTGFCVLDGFDNGPHVIHHNNSLLDLIARLANEEGHPYTMQGDLSPKTVRLRPEMMADDIAAVLGIDVKDVLARYSLLVRPAAQAAATQEAA